MMPCVGQQCVIVDFPGHTHLLLFYFGQIFGMKSTCILYPTVASDAVRSKVVMMLFIHCLLLP